MRWLLRISLFFICFGAFLEGNTAWGAGTCESVSGLIDGDEDRLDAYELDVFFSEASGTRNTISVSNRYKNDRISEINAPGLVFLNCRIAQAYSEIHVDKYLRLLIKAANQVNAP